MTRAATELKKGQLVGKYEILGLLSAGGMAELYLASLTGKGGFRKFVALKRVLPRLAANESFVKMFFDEARITAALSHANIAQVYELAEDPGTQKPLLAMEFVAGQNLEQVVERARATGVPLPLGFACRVVHDVLLGLHSAHTFVEPTTGAPSPVVHRDINPRNVMVTYTGGVKIIDFGVAKARGRLDRTQVGMVKGTIDHMSPEQLCSGPVDGRADLFSVSVLFHNLLTGRHLWGKGPEAATMFKIVREPAPSPLEKNPELPGAIAQVVMRGLEKEKESRWPTARDYARALDRAWGGTFDEEHVAALMGQLFADRIAFTRALLDSGAAATGDLRVMTMSGADDEGLETSRRAKAAPPQGPGVKERGPVADASSQATVADLAVVKSPPQERAVAASEPPVPSGDTKSSDSSRRSAAPPKRRTTEIPTTGGPRRRTQEGLAVQLPVRRRTGELDVAETAVRLESVEAPEPAPRPAPGAAPRGLGLVVLKVLLALLVAALAVGIARGEPQDGPDGGSPRTGAPVRAGSPEE